MVNGHAFLLPKRIRAHCYVDLISRFQRPYLFRVEVWSPERPERRVYEVTAAHEESAATQGMKLYEIEMNVKDWH